MTNQSPSNSHLPASPPRYGDISGPLCGIPISLGHLILTKYQHITHYFYTCFNIIPYHTQPNASCFFTPHIFIVWFCVIGASVEREVHQDAKVSLSQGAEGPSFLGKDWHPDSSLQLLIQTITSLIGAGKGSNYPSYLAFVAQESRQLTQILVPFDYSKP